MHIDMGDDGKYHVLGEGTVVFQREHGAPLTLTNMKYVPRLKEFGIGHDVGGQGL